MSRVLMNALFSTSSSLSLFSLLSLKLPHSILCNTGLARARRKLLAGISFEDALRDARNVKICPTFSETEIQSAETK
jgi:hypothetical protein